jgi:hypothetical protein
MPPVTAYRFIRENRDRHAVMETTGLFGVSRSALCRRAKPGASVRRKERDAEQVRLMRKIVRRHHYRYGSLRVSDITYLRTLDGWGYLTSVMDLHGRKVIGWAFSGA